MRQKFFNWTYIYENGRYDIIPDRNIDRPKTFYKYYALKDTSVDALTHTYIYATHPRQLNDLFDCNPNILDFDNVKAVRDALNCSRFAQMSDEEIFTDDYRTLAQMTFTTLIYKNLGIFSMAKKPDNPLMWAYYTNNCGFCVEYDLSQFGFKHHGPFPINYCDVSEPIRMSQIRDAHLAMLAQTNIKQPYWKHEDEWRLLVESPDDVNLTCYGIKDYELFGGYDRKFSIPVGSIKRVVLGMSFFDFTERKSSLNDLAKTNKCMFQLKETSNKKLKKQILDFLSMHKIRVDYTFVMNTNTISSISMIINRKNENQYEGTYCDK
ncbi:MAG: DUF2971 domain-containing protein [Bacteroidales bacterium]|nr:DUF2971 domain-containing protein [Bacteroidales bacterium]